MTKLPKFDYPYLPAPRSDDKEYMELARHWREQKDTNEQLESDRNFWRGLFIFTIILLMLVLAVNAIHIYTQHLEITIK